jgi:hypothetical protein
MERTGTWGEKNKQKNIHKEANSRQYLKIIISLSYCYAPALFQISSFLFLAFASRPLSAGLKMDRRVVIIKQVYCSRDNNTSCQDALYLPPPPTCPNTPAPHDNKVAVTSRDWPSDKTDRLDQSSDNPRTAPFYTCVTSDYFRYVARVVCDRLCVYTTCRRPCCDLLATTLVRPIRDLRTP